MAAAQRTLTLGQELQLELSLNGRPAQAGALRWTSDRPGVAAVSDSGKISAVSEGTATIRAVLAASERTLGEFTMQVVSLPPVTPQRLDVLTAQVLKLTNEARAKTQTCGKQTYPPAPPLKSETRLGQAAQGHAANMAALGYFSHTSQDGRTLRNRIDATNYPWRAIAENIAAGQKDAQEVVTGWLNSEGHCRNLMNADYREIGIGLAQSAGGKRYWVQNFGTR